MFRGCSRGSPFLSLLVPLLLTCSMLLIGAMAHAANLPDTIQEATLEGFDCDTVAIVTPAASYSMPVMPAINQTPTDFLDQPCRLNDEPRSSSVPRYSDVIPEMIGQLNNSLINYNLVNVGYTGFFLQARSVGV